jgi:hypothetical protein
MDAVMWEEVARDAFGGRYEPPESQEEQQHDDDDGGRTTAIHVR